MPTRADGAVDLQHPYSPHPGFAMQNAVLSNLKEKTGKTLQEWIAMIKKSGPSDPKERAIWLKQAHGLTTNYAKFVAEQADGKSGAENYHPEDLVDAIFSGEKAKFRLVYEQILRFGLSLGSDVKVCPCATIIPFYRAHVFAQVRVPNRSRIDLGFALRDTPAVDPLIDTGGFAKKDRITHRVEIASAEQFNAITKKWLQRAYDMDAR